MLKKVQKIKFDIISNIEQESTQLVMYCNTYPEIEKFVNYVITDFEIDSFDYHVQNCLESFLYELVGFDSRTSKRTGNFFYELNGFIGNYFLDDFYFSITKSRNVYIVEEDNDNVSGNCTQNPLELIEAAKFNAEYYVNLYERIKKRKINV